MLNQAQFLQQLEKLVTLKTISGQLKENALALDYVKSLISPQAKIKLIKQGPTQLLLASNSNTTTPDFAYLVHLDVVAGGDNLFSIRQKQNLIFGRGVSDMKFAAPLGIALLNELIATKNPLTFSLAFTTDEEMGGFNCTPYLINQLNWRPKVLIVPDGGDNLTFVNKTKGVAQFLITAKGKTAHASKTWDGKNALPALCKLVVELEKKYGKNNQQENWKTTLNFGQLNGGISTNQVCDSATLKIDYRYPQTDSIEKIEAKLLKLINTIEPNLTIKKLSTGLPTFTDLKLPVVQQFLSCLEKQFKQKILIKGESGASDARYFAKFNIPILMIKPLGGNIHSENEWLDVDSSMKFYQALRKFLGIE